MKKYNFILLLFLSIFVSQTTLHAQAAINTTGDNPHASAMLEVASTAKGLLTPRMTDAQRVAISSPATGLLVYQTDNLAGFYYYDGTKWIAITSGSKNGFINAASSTVLGLTYLGQSETAANNKPAFRFASDKGYYIDIDHQHQLGTSWIWYSNDDCTGDAYASTIFYGPGATFASPKDGALHYVAQAATATTATVQSRYIVDSNTCQVYSPNNMQTYGAVSPEYYPLQTNDAGVTGITLSTGTDYKVTFE